MDKFVYRYVVHYYIKSVDNDEFGVLAVRKKEVKIPVLRETEHTFVVKIKNKEKRIYKKAVSTYAYENKADAERNFIFRNKRHIKIMQEKCKLISELIENHG